MNCTAYFDLDGCLVDSRVPIATAVDAVLQHHGLARLAPDEVDGVIGPPMVVGFRTLLAARDADVGGAEACVLEFRSVYEREAHRTTTLVPGIESALAAAGARAACIVVTSKPQYLAQHLIGALGLTDRFEAVFGPERMPFDESKIHTLSRARVGRPQSAKDAMIGDRRHDIEAAHACGIRGIGVTWGFGSRAELHGAGADEIIERPGDIPGLFS